MVRKFNGFTLSSSRGLALGKRCGFTLAETMIVIVVLGIIATLTIPALVNKNKESVAKTKVRKAMAAYESALNKMIIENDLKSDTALNEWAGTTANCGNPSNYFKKVQGDGCIFKTSDGIWWNISDIERPVISFKEINADNVATITTNANNANDKTAFVLVGRFGTDGSLRVDDLAYETANDTANSKAQVEKLYSLLGMKKSSSSGGNASPFAACNHADTCVVGGITYRKVAIEAADGYYEGKLISSIEQSNIWISDVTSLYDETDAKSNENCSESRNKSWCESYGDYWTLAKKICGKNAHMSTAGELKALYNAGQLDNNSWYWASESYPGDSWMEYSFYTPNGDMEDTSQIDDVEIKSICVGN